jgi:hypothetical protein
MMSEDFLAAVSPKSRPKFYFEKERPSFHTAWVKGGRVEQVAAAAGSPQKAALLAAGRDFGLGP